MDTAVTQLDRRLRACDLDDLPHEWDTRYELIAGVLHQAFLLSGLSDERVTRVVDEFRGLGVDYVVPQHCTGIEAIATLYYRLPHQMVVTSVGTTVTFSGG